MSSQITGALSFVILVVNLGDTMFWHYIRNDPGKAQSKFRIKIQNHAPQRCNIWINKSGRSNRFACRATECATCVLCLFAGAGQKNALLLVRRWVCWIVGHKVDVFPYAFNAQRHSATGVRMSWTIWYYDSDETEWCNGDRHTWAAALLMRFAIKRFPFQAIGWLDCRFSWRESKQLADVMRFPKRTSSHRCEEMNHGPTNDWARIR